MNVIVDTREQTPFTFQGREWYKDTTTERGTLNIGDYSIKSMENLVACERKSLQDLVGSISHERERFERELQRGKSLEAFMVVVEAPLKELANGMYRSKMNAHAAVQSVVAMQIRYGVPFVFADNVALAEYYTHSFLEKFLAQQFAKVKSVVEASGLPVESLKIRKPRDTA